MKDNEFRMTSVEPEVELLGKTLDTFNFMDDVMDRINHDIRNI